LNQYFDQNTPKYLVTQTHADTQLLNASRACLGGGDKA